MSVERARGGVALLAERTLALRFAPLLGTLLLACCAVGPDFEPPLKPDVTRYTREKLAPRTTATDVQLGEAQRLVNGKDIRGEWWRLYRSPALNTLIDRALAANPNLTAALAALRVAREDVYAQQGKYFPLIQASPNASRQLLSQVFAPSLANGENLFNLFTAQVLVSYTLDVWGQNRRQVESLQATADSQRFQVEAAYLTVTSNVVVAAIQDAALRGQIDATNSLIDINSKMLETLRQQFDRGLVSRNDVAAQEAALAQTKATLPPLRKALAQNRNLLTALLGSYPSQEPSQTFKLSTLHLPVELPLSLPSQLVEQRPDIRSAEEQLHAASASVGVAIANMLPQITLTGNAGYQSAQLANLFTAPNLFWTVAGGLTQPLFDGFILLHQKRAAEAAFDQAREQYRVTVIGAFQNVADALRAIQNDADALKAAKEFETAAKVSLDLARTQMTFGNVNVLYLLNAQITYEQALLALVQAEANRLSDTAALFMALGGGWWNRIDVPSDEGKNALTTLFDPPESGRPRR
jgi:NodT family efflux transporter outer membrane factor (OMF) lipoprotein